MPASAADERADKHVPGEPAGAGGSAADALEAALEQLGPFGLYQRYSLLLLCLPSVLAAAYSLNYVFVADQVPFRCVVEECEGAEGWGFANGSAGALVAVGACCRPAPLHNVTGGVCRPLHYHPVDTVPCDRFLYENHDTVYAEFDLACREWLRTLVGSVRNVALPFALVLTGYVSDSFGRRTAFCIFGACAGVLGLVKGFSVNYQMYLAMEFLEALLGYGFNSAAYVMVVELALGSVRAVFACATGVAYGAGGAALAWLAWRLRYWRHVLWAAHGAALLLPLYWLLADESWRWLLARGRRREVTRLLRKAARWNKVTLDEDVLRALAEGAGEGGEASGKRENPWLGVLRSRVLLGRLAVCGWCWAAAAFVYYGLTINSVSLSGDKFVNFALNMVMEIVASLLLMMALDRVGRKWSICGAFLLCGLACVTPFFVDQR